MLETCRRTAEVSVGDANSDILRFLNDVSKSNVRGGVVVSIAVCLSIGWSLDDAREGPGGHVGCVFHRLAHCQPTTKSFFFFPQQTVQMGREVGTYVLYSSSSTLLNLAHRLVGWLVGWLAAWVVWCVCVCVCVDCVARLVLL